MLSYEDFNRLFFAWKPLSRKILHISDAFHSLRAEKNSPIMCSYYVVIDNQLDHITSYWNKTNSTAKNFTGTIMTIEIKNCLQDFYSPLIELTISYLFHPKPYNNTILAMKNGSFDLEVY